MNTSNLRKIEIISVSTILILAIVLSFVFNFSNIGGQKKLSIFVNGVQITHIDNELIDLNKPGIYTIGDINGKYNVIEIKNSNIRCIDANCPNKLCVSHGFLNDGVDNDMIVCAPHSLVIQFG